MFWRLALVAMLAVGALGEQPNSKEVEDHMKTAIAMMCRQNNATDKIEQTQAAMVTFKSCLEGLVNMETLKQEIEDAKPHGNLDVVFKKYCDKSAELKSCINAAATAVQPCLPALDFDINMVTNATGTLLDFVCYKDGDRIALFIAEEGPQCIESKKKEIGACASDARKETNGATSLLSLSQQQRCDLSDRLISCIVTTLESCENSTPSNMVESLFKYVRKFTPCKK